MEISFIFLEWSEKCKCGIVNWVRSFGLEMIQVKGARRKNSPHTLLNEW